VTCLCEGLLRTVDTLPADADIWNSLIHVFGAITKFFNFTDKHFRWTKCVRINCDTAS